jgi:hypothetical protein
MSTGGVVMNLGIMTLTGLAFWLTRSLWSFAILLFLFSSHIPETKIKTRCPKCEHEFLAVKDTEENEEA